MACLAGLLLAACSSGDGSAGRNSRRTNAKPNIVFVLTDDLSWNLVAHMPNVREMQEQGLTFSNYFVTDSLCCPSRVSILTGRFPHSTGITMNTRPDGGFDVFYERGGEKDTFATSLRGNGYRTALMGKYLNEYRPARPRGQQGPYVPPGWSEWDVGGDAYNEFTYNLNENGRIVAYGNEPADYLTDVLAAKGVSFIGSAASAGDPFLLEMSTYVPHAPYVPAPRHRGLFADLQAPRSASFDKPPTAGPTWMEGLLPLDERQMAQLDVEFRLRVQAVQAVDEMLGRLRAELRTRNQLDNTYIVFSSDNGYHMGEHGLIAGKMTAFDTDIKVPLVVVGPGVPRGKTVDRLTANIDLRPTFEELAGLRPSPEVEGRSLVPFLSGETAGDWRTATFVEHRGPVSGRARPDPGSRFSGNPPSYEAMRTSTELYVEYADGEREYYDIKKDPDQLTNLATRLSDDQKAGLQSALKAMAECKGYESCWAAQRVKLP